MSALAFLSPSHFFVQKVGIFKDLSYFCSKLFEGWLSRCGIDTYDATIYNKHKKKALHALVSDYQCVKI